TRLLEHEGDRVDFVVLYGSMARGDWGRGSDFDVLVGLRENDPRRLLDRLQQFDVYSDGMVEPLSYGPRELESMFQSFNLIVLAALRDGRVLYDRGIWRRYREGFLRLIESGHLVSLSRGWRWTEEAKRLARTL